MNDNDLISRVAALGAISEYGACGICTQRILDIPAVDTAPVARGQWIEKECSENTIEEWQTAKCSNCGKYHTTPYMYYFDNYKYCPNCGAKMME